MSFVAIVIVTIGFSFSLLALVHIPMNIGGSGLTNHVSKILEASFLVCGVLNSALIASRIKIGWVAFLAFLQVIAPYSLTGKTIDFYFVYFSVIFIGGLLLLRFLNKSFGIELRIAR